MSKTHIPADLRRLVRDRAKNACEYCLIPEQVTLVPHQVDLITALATAEQILYQDHQIGASMAVLWPRFLSS